MKKLKFLCMSVILLSSLGSMSATSTPAAADTASPNIVETSVQTEYPLNIIMASGMHQIEQATFDTATKEIVFKVKFWNINSEGYEFKDKNLYGIQQVGTQQFQFKIAEGKVEHGREGFAEYTTVEFRHRLSSAQMTNFLGFSIYINESIYPTLKPQANESIYSKGGLKAHALFTIPNVVPLDVNGL